MAQVSHRKSRSRRKSKKKQTSIFNRNWVISLFALILLVGGVAFVISRSSSTTQTVSAESSSASSSNSDNPYAGIPGPSDWTEETSVQIYNRRNGQWEDAVFGDVGNDMEFIVGDYVYATTEQGYFFLKPEIDISQLAETDRSFDPDNWRIPEADDVVFLLNSADGSQQKGHWLFTYVKRGSEIVFQGKVWRLEYDIANDQMGVVDTGNVFARVTQTHVNFHEDDVLALTVEFDSCGKTSIITGSEEHPFYVLDVEDYIPMVDLQPDMRLKTDNGSLATVVELQSLDKSMELYNLTVEHVQNYYIYTSENDPGVLVHNTGPCWTTAGGRRIDPNHVDSIFNDRGFADWELDNAIDNFDDILMQDDGATIHLVSSGSDTFDVVVTGTGDDNFIVTAYRGLTQDQLTKNINSGVWSR